MAVEVCAGDEYGFTDPGRTPQGTGVPGGVGGGTGYEPRALFYVGVPDVAEALERAETTGWQRVMGPVTAPSGLVVAHFRDPAGNLVGLAQSS